jgi:UDP-2,3-diacylglucosamine pyrophosphatase LpxH
MQMDHKRDVELVVISDVHLGTGGCHASELLQYLRSIRPQTIILNGDIIDVWQFRKRYFPKSHLKVIKHMIGLASGHTRVYYITGNHDELFRKFSGLKIGKLKILNDLQLVLNGEKVWFFHGDVFDVVIQNSKWLAILGAVGYDTLIWINTQFNRLNRIFGLEPVSFSKKVKNSVKKAVKYVNSFEESAAMIAARKGFSAIVCGHIHQPEIRLVDAGSHKVTYLNSGDWIENLTSLEYNLGQWSIFSFNDDFPGETENEYNDLELLIDTEPKQLFRNLLHEFQY